MTDPLHDRFEELSALAAGGDLSSEEFEELQSHLAVCSQCRSTRAEFFELFRSELPSLQPEIVMPAPGRPRLAFLERGHQRRFLARAQAAGIPVAEPRPDVFDRIASFQVWLSRPLIPAYVVALVAVACAGLFLYHQRTTEMSNQLQRTQLETARQENGVLRDQVALMAARPDATKELARTNQNYRAMRAHDDAIMHELEGAKATIQALKEEIASSSQKQSQQQLRVQQAESSVQQLTGQLESMRKLQQSQGLEAANEQFRIHDLERQTEALKESLEQSRKLLAADKDIRNLMGARNLHITDVYDIDEKGTGRAYGRVFYTEGRSLVVYAFDLNDSKVALAKHSFQVWGWHESIKQSALSLGILYMDDKADNRWMLKVDDRSVLSGIDAVFVTMEPAGGSNKPTGKKLLYAYLLGNANHP